MTGFKNISEVKAANKALGHCWFDRETTKYHGSRVETPVMGGFYFVESSWRNTDDYSDGRRFMAVGASPDGDIQYLNGAEPFDTKQAAVDYIKSLVAARV